MSCFFDEGQIERPNPVMLGDRQRPQRAIKNFSGSSDLTLVSQKSTIVHPYSRHLVHENERAFESVVHVFVSGVSNAAIFDLEAARAQVIIPEFV
jgi:hypothetical protein